MHAPPSEVGLQRLQGHRYLPQVLAQQLRDLARAAELVVFAPKVLRAHRLGPVQLRARAQLHSQAPVAHMRLRAPRVRVCFHGLLVDNSFPVAVQPVGLAGVVVDRQPIW